MVEVDVVDMLPEEDTLAQWVKEAKQNSQLSRKRSNKGAPSGKRPITRSRGKDM